MRAVVLMMVAGAAAGFAQTQPAAGRGGPGGGQNAPLVASISQRPPGSSLGTIRAGAADNNIWFGWRVGIPSAAFKQLTLSDALANADTLGVASGGASTSQMTHP